MFDELWPGGPKFHQAEYGFKLGTDSVLLAHFTNPTRAKKILDLGCGAGVLTVLTAYKAPKAQVLGIEIQPESAAVCRENMAANGFAPENILEGDLREHRKLFDAGSFDLVISNPPYFPANAGGGPSRSEICCSFEELCTAANRLLKTGGRFSFVHRPERLTDLLCTLRAHRLEPKRLRFVTCAPDRSPSALLIEAVKNGGAGLEILPPLITL